MNAHPNDIEEFITIIADSPAAVMAEFKAQDMARQGYCIVGRIGQNRFSLADGPQSVELFKGQQLVAGTFFRRINP